MIIKRLKVTNFGRFHGAQQIDLDRGVYVIHGRNGLGKTTLLNAVRWALYGHYSDRQGRPVPPAVMLNRAARREGERQFSAELHIQDGSDTYLIRRTQVMSDAGTPASEQYIERNSSPLTSADRRRAVDHLLNEDIARFFLFDGEQLQQYESLLFRDDTSSRTIKESIEQILGLPVLEQTMADLEAVKDDFGRRMARQARRDSQLQQYALRAEQLQADYESKAKNLNELNAKRNEQESIIADRDAILQQFENSAAALAELDSFAQKGRDLEQQRKQLGDLRAASLQHAWRDMLASVVAPVRLRMETAQAMQQERLRDHYRQDLLRESISRGQCAICDHPLDIDHQHTIQAELSQTTSGTDNGLDATGVGLLTQLASLTDTGQLTSAISLDERLADLESDEIVLRQEELRTRSALQDIPTAEVRTAARERDQAQEEIGRLRERIDEAEAALSDIDNKLHDARSRLRDSNSIEPYLVRALDLAANLQTAFDSARSQFRDELRNSVEATASEVFKELTTEPAYSRLSITENYGLEILDDDGEIVTGRSAGQEQVVALALIAALNRNATRRASVIMDTPFGRLDPDHRANVLRYASRLAEQVFLLVHGGEVTLDDLGSIADQITDQYELQYDDPDRTTLAVRSAL
jgi:DNA sulfur modification protein DndD